MTIPKPKRQRRARTGCIDSAKSMPKPLETEYSNRAVVGLSKAGYRLFRNNTGLFKTLDGKRIVRCGLCPGSSDQIGWHPVVITPEMVGQRIAVFVGLEVKRGDKPPTEEQVTFLDNVKAAGGEAMLVVGDDIQVWEGQTQ